MNVERIELSDREQAIEAVRAYQASAMEYDAMLYGRLPQEGVPQSWKSVLGRQHGALQLMCALDLRN
jgi:hypothetical protein